MFNSVIIIEVGFFCKLLFPSLVGSVEENFQKVDRGMCMCNCKFA